MSLLTEEKAKKLIEQSNCVLKSFSYTVAKNPPYNQTDHRAIGISFSCKNGIGGNVDQYIKNGDAVGHEGSLYISINYKHTYCRESFKDNSAPNPDGFCYTSERVKLGQ